jgi:hypothetical protein
LFSPYGALDSPKSRLMDDEREKGAPVPGLDRPDFIRELGKREMPAFHVDLEDLKKEALRD